MTRTALRQSPDPISRRFDSRTYAGCDQAERRDTPSSDCSGVRLWSQYWAQLPSLSPTSGAHRRALTRSALSRRIGSVACRNLAAMRLGVRHLLLGDLSRRPGQPQNVDACVRSVDDVDVAAVVDLDVVGLNDGLAPLLTVDRPTALG